MQTIFSDQHIGVGGQTSRPWPQTADAITALARQSLSAGERIGKAVLRTSAGVLENLLLGPAISIMYMLAAWNISYSIGLNNSFPWSTGPLSNWMIWLGSAVLLSVAPKLIARVKIPE